MIYAVGIGPGDPDAYRNYYWKAPSMESSPHYFLPYLEELR